MALAATAKEMRATPRLQPLLIDEFQVSLVDERSGVQGEIAMPAPALPMCQRSQLVVNQGKQLAYRSTVASLQVAQHPRGDRS